MPDKIFSSKSNFGKKIISIGEKLKIFNTVTPDDFPPDLLIKASGDLVGTDINVPTGLRVSPKTYQTFVDNYISWVYTSVDKIAKTIAMLPMHLYATRVKGKLLRGPRVKHLKNILRKFETEKERKYYLKTNDIEKEEIFDHIFLDLMTSPNTIMTRYILWYETVMRLELTGTCPWVFELNRLNQPVSIFPLPLKASAEFKVIPNKKTVYGGYIYQDGQKKLTFGLDEVMYMRYPHPGSIFEGYAPLLAQTYPYDIDLFLSQQQYAFFKNQAVPGILLSTDEKLNSTQIADLRKQIQAQKGALKAGREMVLHSGLKLSDRAALTAQESQLTEIAEYARDRIISAYGLSQGKLGLVKDVNRANMAALDHTFYSECIRPNTMMIEEAIEKDILPRYDDALTLDFELPDTSNKELALKERDQNIKSGYTLINEERAKDGLEPVPWGDEPWFPLGLTQPSKKAEMFSGSNVGNDNQNENEDEDEKPDEKKPVKNKDFDYKTILWKLFAEREDAYEISIVSIIRKHFKRVASIVLDNFAEKGKRIEGQLAGWGKIKINEWLKTKDRLSDININKKQFEDELQDLIEPTLTFIVEDAGQYRVSKLIEEGLLSSSALPFNVNDPKAVKWLGTRLDKFSKEVVGTSFDQIKAILREGFQEGLPSTVISDRLREKFASWEQYRAPLIARTESVAAMTNADLLAVEQEGLEDDLNKFWIDSKDLYVRDNHVIAGSQDPIPIKENFIVGADSMLSPGNGSRAEENINCRCTIGYVRKK